MSLIGLVLSEYSFPPLQLLPCLHLRIWIEGMLVIPFTSACQENMIGLYLLAQASNLPSFLTVVGFNGMLFKPEL